MIASQKLLTGVAGIFKDELPYIVEWVAFYRMMGFDRIIIADNQSSDGSKELLTSLQSLGLVDYFDFPGSPGRSHQLDAYQYVINQYSHEIDWLAFIDADEFLIADEYQPIHELIENILRLSSNSNVGAIAINWRTFGSSGIIEYEDDLIVERFTRHANRNQMVNKHYKSLIKTSALASTGGNPHHFKLKGGSAYINTIGKSLSLDQNRGEGLSDAVEWTNASINHYVVKSKSEFFAKKGPRGGLLNRVKGINYFYNHDLNSEEYQFGYHQLMLLKEEVGNIMDMLLSVNFPLGKYLLEFKNAVLDWRQHYEKQTLNRKETLHIDRHTLNEVHLIISGWAFNIDGAPIDSFRVVSKNRNLKFVLKRKCRDDVVRVHKHASAECGFTLIIDLMAESIKPDQNFHVDLGMNENPSCKKVF